MEADLPAAFRLDGADEGAPAAPAVAPAASNELVAALEELVSEAGCASQRPLQRSLRRAVVMAQQQADCHAAELLAMRDVLSCELTDREANAARVVERQAVLADREAAGGGGATAAMMSTSAHERAAAAAEAIEDALCGLETHLVVPSLECQRLLDLGRHS